MALHLLEKGNKAVYEEAVGICALGPRSLDKRAAGDLATAELSLLDEPCLPAGRYITGKSDVAETTL